jgi:hypothetical protein
MRPETKTEQTNLATFDTDAQDDVNVSEWSEPPRDDNTDAVLLWGLTPKEFDRVCAGDLAMRRARQLVENREARWRAAR